MNITKSSLSNNYVYIDRYGQLGIDGDHSLFGGISRLCYSIFKLRNYQLTAVFPIAQQQLQAKDVAILTGKLAKSAGLNEQEFRQIQLLSRNYFDPQSTYTSTELSHLKELLLNAKGNLRINKACNTLLALNTNLAQVNRCALQTLRTFSFETTKIPHLSTAFQKMEIIQRNLTKNGILKTSVAPLSFFEMREIESVTQLAPVFTQLKKMGLTFERSSDIGHMRRAIYISHQTLNRLKKCIRNASPSRSFNLIFYDSPNVSSLRSLFTRITCPLIFWLGFKSHIFHVALSYQGPKQQEMEAHMMQRFVHEKRPLTSHAFKTFTPNFDAFFNEYPDRGKQALHAVYGENWKHILTHKFRASLQHIFQTHRSEHHALHNPILRRFLGGIGLQSLFRSGDFYNTMQLSHKKEAICTEFVMKILMQSYAHLEHSIQQDLEKVRTRSSRQVTPKRSFISTHINLPKKFSQHVAHSVLAPPQLARTLVKQQWISEVPRPPILAAVMDYHTYTL